MDHDPIREHEPTGRADGGADGATSTATIPTVRRRRSPVADLPAARDAATGEEASPVAVDEARLAEVLEVIRPALHADGGDLVYHGVDDRGVVSVELVGACGTCPVSTQTLKAGVERILRDRVPGVTEVVQVNAVE